MHREQLVESDIDTAAWEEAAEGILADVPYDTELGTEMGRDAIRLARGELSERTFQERYHDAVLEEFGDDDRPTNEE